MHLVACSHTLRANWVINVISSAERSSTSTPAGFSTDASCLGRRPSARERVSVPLEVRRDAAFAIVELTCRAKGQRQCRHRRCGTIKAAALHGTSCLLYDCAGKYAITVYEPLPQSRSLYDKQLAHSSSCCSPDWFLVRNDHGAMQVNNT